MTEKAASVWTTIISIKRLNNSPNGNPVWELRTGQGMYRTEPDAQIGYLISENSPFAVQRKPVVLTLNGSGRVIGIREGL